MFCTTCESSDVSTPGTSAGKKMRTLFVKGCPSMRIESLHIHAKCETHVRNTEIKKAKETPVGMSEADRCLRMLNQTALNRLKMLFRTSHSLAKHGRPFCDFTWQCALDKAKGLDLGVTYINEKQCKVFMDAISEVERGKLEKKVCDAPYFSIMCDESTDAAIVEQLILYIRFSVSGVPQTHFLAIQSLERATAENCYTEILRALYEQCGLKSEDVWKKLVGFGSDGASVMTGKNSGVAARLRQHQPALQAVHCIAHRLELAIKDALKVIPAYEKLQQFLFNLCGFYHSTLNRGLLRSTAEALSVTRFIPARTGGTRWIGHTKEALENFHSGMPAILQNMLEIKDDQQTSAATKGKIAGFIKLLSSKSFLDFSYFMRDVVNVLARLSKYFQIQELAIAEMPQLVRDTIALLKKLKTQHGPLTREFRRKIDQDPVFHEHTGQQLDGPLMPLTTFHSVLDKLTESISLRLNVNDPILDAAVRITNLKCWPVHKEDESDGRCPSPQYAVIGQEGIIECSVPLKFKGVVWYNSTNTTDSLVARIERQSDGTLRISGEGVNTGGYTIPSNGSLIISEVTTKHDRNFKVLIIDEIYDTSSFTVELITVVYSGQRFPEVNSCEENLVFLEPVTRNATLSCTFQNARPAVTLSWFKFNKGKFANFEATQYSSSEDGLSFTSVSNVTIHNLTYNSLHAFSCRAYVPAVGDKEVRTDVLVIAENKRIMSDRKCHTEIRMETVFVDSVLKIRCTEDGHPHAFIWQFEKNNHSQILVLSVNGKVRSLNETNSKMNVSADGSITFSHVARSMKGLYTCFFLVDDFSSCNNVELQIKTRVGIKTEDNSRAPSTSPWVIILFVVVVAFVALLLFFYVLNRLNRRNLNFRFEAIKKFEKEDVTILRTISMEIEEYRESYIVAVLRKSKDVIEEAKTTLPGAVKKFILGESVGLEVDGEAEEAVEEEEEAAGAGQNIEYSHDKLVKDQDRVNIVKPALEAFITIQRDLAEIVVLLFIAYKVAGSKKWRRRLSRKILKKSKSFLQDIQAMQSGEKESFNQILSKIKIKANDLVGIAIGPEFKTENKSPQNSSQWENFFQENPRKPFDYLEEAVKTILQEQKDLNGTPTLLTFVKQLYGNLPDSTAADRSIEGNTHAANLSDDGSIVGANISKIAKGVSAVGVVLSAVGVKVDLEFLGKAACNILGEEREQFSSALRDASDVMEKINSIASGMYSVQDSSV